MKNRMDGPATVDDFVQVSKNSLGDTRLQPSHLAAKVQAEYGKNFGMSKQGAVLG